LHARFAGPFLGLTIRQRVKISFAVDHAKNEHLVTVHAKDDDVLAYRKGPRPGAEILVTGAANVGETGQKKDRSVIESTKRVATSMLPPSLAA
jgi:hypothetical protein